eukprot:241979-Chlamydomonas_euryale.AAC.5
MVQDAPLPWPGQNLSGASWALNRANVPPGHTGTPQKHIGAPWQCAAAAAVHYTAGAAGSHTTGSFRNTHGPHTCAYPHCFVGGKLA